MATSAKGRSTETLMPDVGWAAMLFPANNHVIGALRGSDTLHLERDAALEEAARWLNGEPIEWTFPDESTAVGRPQSGMAIAVVKAIRLPKPAALYIARSSNAPHNPLTIEAEGRIHSITDAVGSTFSIRLPKDVG